MENCQKTQSYRIFWLCKQLCEFVVPKVGPFIQYTSAYTDHQVKFSFDFAIFHRPQHDCGLWKIAKKHNHIEYFGCVSDCVNLWFLWSDHSFDTQALTQTTRWNFHLVLQFSIDHSMTVVYGKLPKNTII